MNVAIILIAGNGTRCNEKTPKQFLLIKGKPLCVYTLEKFEKNPLVDEIIAVSINTDLVLSYKEKYHLSKLKYVVPGGITRQESVRCGLNQLKKNGIKKDDVILIHDGARPLVNDDIIEKNIQACRKYHAVNTVFPSFDSIIRSSDGLKEDDVLLRKEIYLVQTPQTFDYEIISKAHDKANIMQDTEATDDCSLVKKYVQDVYLVSGERQNFKITTQDDLKLFEFYLDKEN